MRRMDKRHEPRGMWLRANICTSVCFLSSTPTAMHGSGLFHGRSSKMRPSIRRLTLTRTVICVQAIGALNELGAASPKAIPDTAHHAAYERCLAFVSYANSLLQSDRETLRMRFSRCCAECILTGSLRKLAGLAASQSKQKS